MALESNSELKTKQQYENEPNVSLSQRVPSNNLLHTIALGEGLQTIRFRQDHI